MVVLLRNVTWIGNSIFFNIPFIITLPSPVLYHPRHAYFKYSNFQKIQDVELGLNMFYHHQCFLCNDSFCLITPWQATFHSGWCVVRWLWCVRLTIHLDLILLHNLVKRPLVRGNILLSYRRIRQLPSH